VTEPSIQVVEERAGRPLGQPSGVMQSTWIAVLRALRPLQWVKNLLLFVPVVLDHRVFDTGALARAGLAFAAFSLAASGAYLLNDILDLEADRRHPSKRFRPLAAGRLSVRTGMALVPVLSTLALVLAGFGLSRRFLALLVLYVVATTAYSSQLKRVAVLDVVVLAGLYTLRVMAGVAATGVRFSTWLLAFSMFLFLSLAFVKRYAELSGALQEGAGTARRRGYLPEDREWLGSMGGASGYISVLVLALYINSEQVVTLYRRPLALWLVCPLLLFWIGRMWLLAYRGRIHEDPIVATVRDPVSYVVGVLVGAVLMLASL
jgi:4-hydroxybenzoate polyprenyltransferase